MPLVIDVQLDGIEGLRKSQVNRALKRANIATGKHFRRRFLPARFTEQGGRRLKYTPRSGELRVGLPKREPKSRRKYAPRKQRFLGHSNPLVFSSEGRRLALYGPQIVRATSKTIRIPLPRKYNFRNPRSRVNMADEIRTVANREARELSEFLVKQIEREFARDIGGGAVNVQSASISNL